jgi:hypothetical protein
MSHSLLYLIVELNDELIAEYESEKECVERIADRTMMNMVENHEGFDWYGVEEALPFETVKADILIMIADTVKYTTEQIAELRTFFDKYMDSELAVTTEWRFDYLCNRIGQYAGTDVSVYLIDEYGSYEGIRTMNSLDYMIKDKKNLWVATVDAHS